MYFDNNSYNQNENISTVCMIFDFRTEIILSDIVLSLLNIILHIHSEKILIELRGVCVDIRHYKYIGYYHIRIANIIFT